MRSFEMFTVFPYPFPTNKAIPWPPARHGVTVIEIIISLRSGCQTFLKTIFIESSRRPRAFKLGDEWRPERSVGNLAKPGGYQETLDFSPGSFIDLPSFYKYNLYDFLPS